MPEFHPAAHRRIGHAALGLTVVACALALHFGTVPRAGIELALDLIALASFGTVFLIERRTPFLRLRVVWAAAAVLLVTAVLLPPQGSRDIWSYAAYGRMATTHHVNPYVHRPSEFPTDPAVQRMAPGWRHTRTVYGPVFTGLSAAGMAAAGRAALPERLFFQGMAALAVVAAMALLARSGAGPAAVAWVGINPAVIAVVGGGHNDVLLGAAVLAGVIAAQRKRAALAGAFLAIGVLVKVSGLLPLVAVLAWLALRRGWRPAFIAAATSAALIGGGYLLVGGPAALQPLTGAASYRSRASFWDQPAAWVGRHLLGWGPVHPGAVTTAAGLAVLSAAAIVVAARLRDADPAVLAGGAALVYLLGAAYVLPWYAGWALPVLALAWRSRLAVVAMLQAGALLVVYADGPGVEPDLLHAVMRNVGTVLLPVAELLTLLALVAVSGWRVSSMVRGTVRRSHAPAPAPVG